MELEDGILLLLNSKKQVMTVREAVEIIEMVSKDSKYIKNVLKTAEERGLLTRSGVNLTISEGVSRFPNPRIKRFDCDSSCKRCGLRIKNCFYVQIDDREFGPYGSGCVNRIL
jgi:murein endopeptidase